MKKVVISLGGSLIIPDKVNINYLEKFRQTLKKHYSEYKFIIVCGGGSIARKYIQALKEEGKSKDEQSQAGIRATRMNAQFLMQIFGKEANSTLPMNMEEVRNNLLHNNVVICGALRWAPDSTSDGTSAKLAHFLECDFINMTNVPGLFTENPLTNKKAKFIPYQNWKDFEKRALKIKFHAGQHFVLDQKAATLIRQNRTKTYIIGPNLPNLEKLIKNKPFKGTTIEG